MAREAPRILREASEQDSVIGHAVLNVPPDLRLGNSRKACVIYEECTQDW